MIAFFNSSKLQLLKAISCLDTDNGKEAFIQTRMIPDAVLGISKSLGNQQKT